MGTKFIVVASGDNPKQGGATVLDDAAETESFVELLLGAGVEREQIHIFGEVHSQITQRPVVTLVEKASQADRRGTGDEATRYEPSSRFRAWIRSVGERVNELLERPLVAKSAIVAREEVEGAVAPVGTSPLIPRRVGTPSSQAWEGMPELRL